MDQGDLTAAFGTVNETSESGSMRNSSKTKFMERSSKLNSRRQMYANDKASLNSANTLEKPVSSLKTRLHQTMLIQKEMMES